MKSPVLQRRVFAVAGFVFAGLLSLVAHGADSMAPTAPPSVGTLQTALDALAQRARPGLFGIAVLDLQSGAEWRVNADHAYPMMSVFKAPVAAVVLSRIDEGTLTLQQQVVLTRADLQDGSAVPSIGAHFHGERMTFTVEQLLTAAVSESDSTAVDALVRLVGGPAVVTAFLQQHGLAGMRVDMDEAGISRVFNDLQPGEQLPVNESPQHALQRQRRGYQAFLADPRNRSTPDAAVAFLRKLWRNELLSPAATRRLLTLMYGQTVPNRVRAGLPPGIRWADKCGTSDSLDGETAAYNDIGILTWPDGHAVIVAAFLSASHATKVDRDQLFVELGRAVVAARHP